MKNGLSITVVGLSLTAVFAATYVVAVLVCIAAAGLGYSGMMTTSDMMSTAMQTALPGFGWHVAGFLIGLVLTAVYAFWIAVVFVPVYNYLQRHLSTTTAPTPRVGEPFPAAR